MNKDAVSQIERWGFVFLDRNWGIRVKFVYFVNNVPYLSTTSPTFQGVDDPFTLISRADPNWDCGGLQ